MNSTDLDRETGQPAAVEEAALAADMVGDRLVEAGLINAEQLRYVRRIQQRLASPANLVAILEELRLATLEQVRLALASGKRRIPVRLGELLMELGYVRDADVRLALSIQQERPGQKIGSILLENHSIREDVLADMLSIQLGIERLDPRTCGSDPPPSTEAKWLRTHEMIPIGKRDDSVVLALADPLDSKCLAAAREAFGPGAVIGIAARGEILAAIERTTAERPKALAAAESAVVEAVQEILHAALAADSSGIHVEPQKYDYQVRFRLDGVLVNYRNFPLEMGPALVGRLKTLAKLDVAEKRRPQEGRLAFEARGSDIEIGMSTYVSVHGETVVLRLPSSHGRVWDIRQLGMGPRMLQSYTDKALDAPGGIVIITGPAISGKTTTLYASIQYLNRPHVSIITAEDPLESVVDGVTQCSINPRWGFNFEETLKHALRQDADVLVMGELRDALTAEIAIQAASYGQKVLTTLNTVDSIAALVRLLSANADALLLSSIPVSILSQRLLRRVCSGCAESRLLGPHELSRLGYVPKDTDDLHFKTGRGCTQCHFRGCQGRVAVFELLMLNDPVKDAVMSRRSACEIRRLSLETGGMATLLEDAILKGADGRTTFDEIMRRVPRVDGPRHITEIRRLLGEIQ